MTNYLIQEKLNEYVKTSKGKKANDLDKNIDYYTKFFNTTYNEFDTQFTDVKGREFFIPENKKDKFPFKFDWTSKADVIEWSRRIIFIKIKKKFREEYGWPKIGEKIIANSDKSLFVAKIESIFFGERRATGWCEVDNLITFSSHENMKEFFSTQDFSKNKKIRVEED